jgi:glucokinase
MVEEKTPAGAIHPGESNDAKHRQPPGVSIPTVLGVDVGGTKILVGAVTRSGEVLASRRYSMDRSTQALTLSSIQTAVADFMSTWAGPALLAVGLGVVGHTKPSAGLWVRAMNLPIHAPVPLGRLMRKQTGLPSVLDNDVHAATLAEIRWGIGKETKDFIYLNIGTGLAAGLVCNGQLVRGSANYAGELGHVLVDPGGSLCICGQRGCLEPICSGDGIVAQAREGLRDYPDSILFEPLRDETLTANQVFQAAESGDRLAIRITGKAVQALSTALTNLVNLLNPAVIVYGGGVLKDGNSMSTSGSMSTSWLMEKVGGLVSANALVTARRALKGIWPSSLNPERVGLLGAASLAWNYLEKRGR